MKVIYKLIVLLILLFIILNRNNFFNKNEYFEYFEFNHNGSSKEDCYNYIIKKEKNNYYLYINENKKSRISNTDINKINDLFNKYNIIKWNGFNKNNKHVLDGYSFSLELRYKNKIINAKGNNSFPKNYYDVINELKNILKNYKN